jgi:hypothetical protein
MRETHCQVAPTLGHHLAEPLLQHLLEDMHFVLHSGGQPTAQLMVMGKRMWCSVCHTLYEGDT